MKLIKPSFKIIGQQPELEGLYKQIEIAGRTCYKSEDKITEDSAKGFVERMIQSGHGAMLEHGTVYLKIPFEKADGEFGNWVQDNYFSNPYTYINFNNRGDYFITTNLRVLVENGRLDDLKYLCEPTEYHERRITVKFICDRGVSHEFVRHRVFSFAQESTRYCNYSKDKFNNEITYIIPSWCTNIKEGNTSKIDLLTGCKNLTTSEVAFLKVLEENEDYYFVLLNLGWKPQEARAILPNALKTELVMTGFVSDWKHFFKLRDAGNAHPQARELAQPLHEKFIELGYI